MPAKAGIQLLAKHWVPAYAGTSGGVNDRMKKLYDRICVAEAIIAAALLLIMVTLIFLSGVMRTFGHPINWSNDIATAMFAWACFLCADVAWRKNALMSIELVTSRMPPGMRKLCAYASYAIIVMFLVYALVGGIYLSWISRARSFQGIPSISYSWVTMSMPVGSALLLITAFLKIRDEVRGAAPQPATTTG
jgi:TRAP-type C4-dicarboxylate transport system permease small subunit